jgi:hypothetical protein
VLTAIQAAGQGNLTSGTGWPRPLVRPAVAVEAQPAVLPLRPVPSGAADKSAAWLRGAAVGLVLLAAAAAAVSFSAQYRMADAARRLPAIAGLEAAIPDAAALVFACLGIALALHGRRAVRARFLNLAAVGTSVFMNAIAASPGWRDLAIWVMPPVAYALASDTLIGVVRAHSIARSAAHPGDDEATPLAALGGAALWLLRLALAPASTLAGFRSWVMAECPVAPGRRAGQPDNRARRRGRPARKRARSSKAPHRTRPASPDGDQNHQPPRPGGTKTARFLEFAEREHGLLAAIPLDQVARIAATLAPAVGLHAGSARTALRRAVLAAQNRSPR